MEKLRRPQFIGGEMHYSELFSGCPNELITEAIEKGVNIAFDNVRVNEFTPDGQMIESFSGATNFRLVEPRESRA